MKQLWALIEPIDKKRLLILIFLSILAAGFDILGISILMPYLNFMISSDGATEFIKENFGFEVNISRIRLIAISSTFIVFIYCFKAVFLVVFEWIRTKFSYAIGKKNGIKTLSRLYLQFIYCLC